MFLNPCFARAAHHGLSLCKTSGFWSSLGGKPDQKFSASVVSKLVLLKEHVALFLAHSFQTGLKKKVGCAHPIIGDQTLEINIFLNLILQSELHLGPLWL